MKTTPLIVVGSGKFASVFTEQLNAFSKLQGGPILAPQNLDSGMSGKITSGIVLHVGSGRQLQETIDFCQKHRLPLVQASSGLKPKLPSSLKFLFIDAPNLSLPIVRLLALLESFPRAFKEFNVQGTESHQSTKTTVPATAVRLNELLGGKPGTVKSIRNPKIQKTKFKVPKKHLSGHAIHQFSIKGQGAEITLGTRVLGRETYLYGLMAVAKYVIAHKPKPGQTSISELVRHSKI
jgi:dihydrodipicolinate reductase